MVTCCRSQFLLRASCYNNGAGNAVMEVASVRRQQDVIAVGRCFWLTGLFKCWTLQEKIQSGCFSDACRGGSLTVLYMPCCTGSWSLSKSTLARAELQEQGSSSACSLPSLLAAADGMQLLLRGKMDGRDRLVGLLDPVSYWQFLSKGNLCSMYRTETFPKVASFEWKNIDVVFWFEKYHLQHIRVTTICNLLGTSFLQHSKE